jgi:hypothetical protein
LLRQRNTELRIGLQQFRIYLVEALQPLSAGLWRRVIDEVLVVDRRIVDVGPFWLSCDFSSFTQCGRPSYASPANLARFSGGNCG